MAVRERPDGSTEVVGTKTAYPTRAQTRPARFYASVLPLRIECPACGALTQIGGTACEVRRSGFKRRHRTFNRALSRFTCPGCGKRFVVGLLLWEAPKGGKAVPADCRPSPAQLAELRATAGGFWTDAPRAPADPVHVYLPEACCCDPLPWRAECPVHGGKIP